MSPAPRVELLLLDTGVRGVGPATELELLSTLQTHKERRREGEEGHTENMTLIGSDVLRPQ